MTLSDDAQAMDAYRDWAARLRGQSSRYRSPEPEPWEVLLVVPLDLDVFDQIRKDDALSVNQTEQDFVERICEATKRLPPFLLHRRHGYLPKRPLFRPLVRSLSIEDDPKQQARSSPAAPQADDAPLLAVIDDGLGFLNERFQRVGPGGWETRVAGVFIQSEKENLPPLNGMSFGRVLSRAEVQAFALRPDEHTAYKEINAGVFAADTFRSNEQAASHGTHITDLAGGADPTDTADPMRDVPMVLVQLPPQIVDDTSGRWLVPHVLEAFHWILLQAFLLGTSHVVVNTSFGITAGSKDGNSLFAGHTAFLIHLAAILGIRLDIVVPFGNDYQNRQVAQVAVDCDTPARVDVRLQPDDRAPSYIEIRPEGSTPLDTVGLGLVAPNGDDIPTMALAAGASRDVLHRGRVVGRITHIAAQQGRLPYLLIALAPTSPARDDGSPANGFAALIEAGVWQIVLESPETDPQDFRFEIQRGDSMPTYRQRGRQAYFDGVNGYTYDSAATPGVGNPVASKAYTELSADAYTTHDGTNSAFTVVPGGLGQFHTVGGAFLANEADGAVAAQYASLNTRSGRGVVSGGARSEHNRVLAGLRASGVLSGSSTRFSGSSAAAAVFSRNLILGRDPMVTANAPGRLPEKIYPGWAPRD